MAPHRNHEAVEGAHRGEDDQSDEPRADGDQLLRTAAERISTTTLLAGSVCRGDFSVYFRSLDCNGSYVCNFSDNLLKRMKHFKLGCFDECYLRGGVGCGALLYKGEDQAGPRPQTAAAPAQQPPCDLLPAIGLLHQDDELREESEQDH